MLMGVESSIIVAYVTYIIVVLIIATGIQLRTSSSLGTRSAIILSNVIMLPLTIVAMLVAGHLVAGLDMGEVASTLVFALAAVLLLAVARHALPAPLNGAIGNCGILPLTASLVHRPCRFASGPTLAWDSVY